MLEKSCVGQTYWGYIMVSKVEEYFIVLSGYKPSYSPTEKLRTVIVCNFPELGRMTALRFLEWVQSNPGGVISLPTGKTPEHFIKWVEYYLKNWDKQSVQQELVTCGIKAEIRPDMANLHFVQMDEFYPIDSSQPNSFCHYVKNYYIKGFGLDPTKSMLIDCNQIGLRKGESLYDVWPDGKIDLTLQSRTPETALERRQKQMLESVEQWCDSYEQKIAELGGIGFFLGGIGPDGHIAFNIRGSAHDSTTRLMATNYETQAAAAGDLGGMDVSGTKPVITIGLKTITARKDCTAIIMAAGEAKAPIVAASIQNAPNPLFPGTALQSLPNSTFYLTRGAAKLLRQRELQDYKNLETVHEEHFTKAAIDIALARNKRLLDLTANDFQSDDVFRILASKHKQTDIEAIKEKARQSLIKKIESGIANRSQTCFLHTEPHHDDIMLGYQPALVRDLHDETTEHHFCTMTSGFTAVTNQCTKERALDTLELIARNEVEELDDDTCIARFLYGLAARNKKLAQTAQAQRFYRCIKKQFNLPDQEAVQQKLQWLVDYFDRSYPGKKDIPDVQILKGMMREWEAETLWGVFGIRKSHVNHLRLGFYQGKLFTEEPTENRDIPPIVNLLNRVKPDILSVALDPEASGPDTHYKVLQAIAAALRYMKRENAPLPKKIWGYRNVWYRFHPAEASLIIPVGRDELAVMHELFMETFVTQRDAAFPSYEHNGPFSELAQKIQVDQYQKLRTCLGEEWFRTHTNPRIRAACAMVFLHEMSVEHFLNQARNIRQRTENA